MTDMLIEALEYARRGWYVFPCREKPGVSYTKNGETIVPQEKTPYVSKGLNDATVDEDQIRAWWGMWKNAMIGINAGKSGLFVIDIDKKHVNGLDTYSQWDINDSAGLRSITPSGGMHIIFSGTGKSSTNAKTGIDTRGEGGYFIAPPSKIFVGEHAGEYTRINDWSNPPGVIPDGLMSRLFPESTVEYVRGSSTPATDGVKKNLSRATLNFMLHGAIPGERNSSLFKAAADMAGCGYSFEEAKEFLLGISEKIEIPSAEFDHVLAQAYSKPRTPSIPDSIQEKLMSGDKNVATKITFEEEIIMESAVIACMLMDNNAIPIIQDILEYTDFHNTKNMYIYSIINQMYSDRMKVDYISVSNEILKKTDKITLDDISNFTTKYYVNSENAITYANIIKEKSSLRKLEALLSNKDKYIKNNVIEGISTLEKDVADISLGIGGKSSVVLDSSQATKFVHSQIERMSSGEIEQLKIGFSEYDKHIGGLYSNEMVVCAARAGDGKCLKKGTLVVMSDGSMKKAEDVSLGDTVMGVDSKPKKVLALSSGRGMLYTIKQNRAQSYTVNSNHILSLKQSNNSRQSTHGNIINISIRGYLSLNKKEKKNLKGYKVGVEFPKKELAIEPYFLGIWLGDGTSSKPQITTQDPEIKNYIYDYANKLNMQVSEYHAPSSISECMSYSISGGMLKMLKDENLIRNKHIPFNYLTSDRTDRLELLAGLLDTDGNVMHNGFEIIQKDRELLKQIKWLADSLGFRTSPIKEKVCTIKSTGFRGIYYRITIHGQMSLVPTKIERKQIPFISKKVDQTVTGIEVIEEGVNDYYGFTVEDELFLLEDFTVTHNSALALSILNHVSIVQRKPTALFSLEMSTHESVCRLVCQLTGLPFKKVYQGRLENKSNEWTIYNEAMQKISDSHIYFDESFGITVPEIRSKIRKLVDKGIELVVIDQLEQIKGYPGMPVYVQFDKIAYDIKNLTQEFNIPIILNHQLNRNITDRHLKNPEPQLSDLNQAGEKPANQVWIISHKKDERGTILHSKIKVLKNRNGPRIEFAVIYVGERMLFSNPEREEDKYVFHSGDEDDVLPFYAQH